MNKKISISHLTFIVKDIEKSLTPFRVSFDDLWIALMENEVDNYLR